MCCAAVSNPFGELKLASFEPLRGMKGRTRCPKCHAKRKYFCYDCFVPLLADPALTPHIELPIICDVIHYATEAQSKSTAVHAKVVAFESVRVHPFPSDTLHEWDPEDTVVLFPSDDAVSVKDLDFNKVKHVVFVESQWHTAKRILGSPQVSKLRHVKIENYETRFWRWQNVGNEGLATIEAIYYFYREFITATNGSYHGEVDNLMYYFSFYYELLQDVYKRSGREFRRIKGFINDDPTSDPSPLSPPLSSQDSPPVQDSDSEDDENAFTPASLESFSQ